MARAIELGLIEGMKIGFEFHFKQFYGKKGREKNIAPENKDEKELSNVIFQWDNSKDPDNDQFTYSIYISKNKTFDPSVKPVREQLIDTMCMVKLPDWNNSDVYWKVIATDDYGAQSESDVWKFHIVNKQDALPIVFVHVYDIKSNRPIPNALVKFETKDSPIEMTMNQQGHYIERMQPGEYVISILGDHYTFEPDHIIIDTQPEISFSFGLTSTIQTGDINRNGMQDIGDVIQCLQVISGIGDAYYFDQGALTGDVPGLRDAIFMMQELSEMD